MAPNNAVSLSAYLWQCGRWSRLVPFAAALLNPPLLPIQLLVTSGDASHRYWREADSAANRRFYYAAGLGAHAVHVSTEHTSPLLVLTPRTVSERAEQRAKPVAWVTICLVAAYNLQSLLWTTASIRRVLYAPQRTLRILELQAFQVALEGLLY